MVLPASTHLGVDRPQDSWPPLYPIRPQAGSPSSRLQGGPEGSDGLHIWSGTQEGMNLFASAFDIVRVRHVCQPLGLGEVCMRWWERRPEGYSRHEASGVHVKIWSLVCAGTYFWCLSVPRHMVDVKASFCSAYLITGTLCKRCTRLPAIACWRGLLWSRYLFRRPR